MSDKWQEWSNWLQEGHFVSYIRQGVRYYEQVISRDLAHWVYDWPETVTEGQTSGPYTEDKLEITKGYDRRTNTNHIWQLIFGIRGEVYIYVELPSDLHRHGIPKIPKPSSDYRAVSHFEEWFSNFHEPSFLTEHFMMREENSWITFSAYNPSDVDQTEVKLNLFIAKLITERIGTEQGNVLEAKYGKFDDVLQKLSKRTIPVKPLTLQPVRAPAQATTGQ